MSDESVRETAGESGAGSRSAPSTLSVVATPIGNLEDLSPRARRTLAECDLLLAEDTRVTRQLLHALGIAAKEVWRFDAHRESEGNSADGVLARLASGARVALVSDAGTPGISDPGARLVERVHEAGFAVVPVPGPSALATFVSAVGVRAPTFTFGGFLPREKGKRAALFRAALSDLALNARVYFESPERIEDTLALLAEHLPAARLALGKELTKRYERLWVGSTVTVYKNYLSLAPAEKRGEWILLFEGMRIRDGAAGIAVDAAADAENAKESVITEPAYALALRTLRAADVRLGDAVRAVCHVFGASRNEVYREGLKIFSD